MTPREDAIFSCGISAFHVLSKIIITIGVYSLELPLPRKLCKNVSLLVGKFLIGKHQIIRL